MITWMQRHKKWLVIVMWISTFAFVGAGFVGWGSYDYGSSSSNVATVGKKEIKISDLQSEYNALYNRYQDTFGEAFNQEFAKQFNLEEVAYDAVIQKFILLNYAEDLGLYITDKEVAKTLVDIPSFIKNGKFNKDIYVSVLKQNKTNPTDFEYQIRQDLLLGKIQTILNINITKTELKNLSLLNSLQDKVSIKIINIDDAKVNSSTDKVKTYWSKNKENYKSLETYEIAITNVKIGTDKKASKKEALKQYLKIKKGDLKFDNIIVVDQNTDMIIPETIDKVTKPVEYNGDFIIVKLVKKIPSEPLPFDSVSKLVKKDYVLNQKQLAFKESIDKLTQNFKGYDIGFVNENKLPTIKDLTQEEIQQLVSSILNSQTTVNSLIIGDKAIVYQITDSKFLNTNIDKDFMELTTLLTNIKNNELIKNLIKQLKMRYEIISNMKAQ